MLSDFAAQQNHGYSLNLYIKLSGQLLSVLLYANDLALVADIEQQLQQMLDALQDWCSRWKLTISSEKSAVVHFRTFRCGGVPLNIWQS